MTVIRAKLTVGVALAAAAAGSASAQTHILVCDSNGDRVVRYEYDGAVPVDHFVAKNVSVLTNPKYLTITPDGDLAIPSGDTNSVELYDGQTGQHMGALITSRSGGLTDPRDVEFGPDGSIYVASSGTGQVLKYSDTGVFQMVLREDSLDFPTGMAFGPDGNLYVCDRDGDKVRGYDPDTGERTVKVELGNTSISMPVDVIFADNGDMYVAGVGSDSVAIVRQFGGDEDLVDPGLGGLNNPNQLALDEDGNLLVASKGTGEIIRYDGQDGEVIGVLLTEGMAGLNSVIGIAFAPEATGNTGGGDDGCGPADIDNDGDQDIDDIELFVDLFINTDCNE